MEKINYLSPVVEAIALVTESCIAASVRDTLQDMQGNSIYDEEF